ncbi:hypothetical protein GLOIN_2v149054 [Rhizophagus clarus]|uniref:Uncharacterized protein n=1 Tax=Rhizophagus clarus TaxID=94130 RepID=A0A8H3QQF5_9GLOM|nr:hypothetical protein GLOIN_2v149054 [Rhizophagus clarus]
MQRTNSPVEKTLPYKKRTLRSTTKSEIINATTKNKKSDNYTSITDESIAKDTYSIEEEGENSDDTIKPNRQNKRNKTKEDNSKDVNMQETSHPISSEQDVPDVSVNETLQILHKETSNSSQPSQHTLNDSIHSPNNNTTSSPANEGQSRDQGNSQDSMNKETQDQHNINTNKDTIMLDTNDEFTTYGGQHNYAVFTFLKSFKSYKNDPEGVINLIRTCFHANDSFIGVSSRPVIIGQIPLLILRFNNKTYADALHNTFNDKLKVTFYKFDEETVNLQIANYLENIDKKTIKLVDIEANFPTETIITVFKNAYGPIEKVQEIFKRPFIKNQSTFNNNPSNQRQQRQRSASSCSFTTPPRRQSFKIAYAYVPKSKFINNYTKFNVFNTTIYIFPSTHNNSCTICGNPSHEYQTCDKKSDNNPAQSHPFKKSLINRNSNNKISLNSDITKKFKHLLTGNFTTFNNEQLLKHKLQPIMKPHIQPHIPSQLQRPMNTDNWDTPLMELQSEINTLKASLKDAHAKISTLSQENKDLKNQITKL